MCISILHAPGDDPMGYESSAERWSPVQSVEKILLSVVSMLAGEPYLTSPSIMFIKSFKCTVNVYHTDRYFGPSTNTFHYGK